MSKLKIPPMRELDVNLDAGPYRYLQTDGGYDVMSYTPGRAGANVPCTEVHLVLPLDENTKLVMRLKSTRALDKLVGVLLQHRKDVWG